MTKLSSHIRTDILKVFDIFALNGDNCKNGKTHINSVENNHRHSENGADDPNDHNHLLK